MFCPGVGFTLTLKTGVIIIEGMKKNFRHHTIQRGYGKRKLQKIIAAFLFSISLILPLSVHARNQKLEAMFFYSTHCKACLAIKTQILPAIKEKYKGKVEWRELNTSDDQKNLTMLFALAMQFKKDRAVTPSILVGDVFLTGKEEIVSSLEKTLVLALMKNSSPFEFIKIDLIQVFKKLSFFTVMGSGFIDGINPCAFAVIVFLISFLAVYGYRKTEMLYIGLFYCFAVFLTYLSLGFGFFKFLYALETFYLVIKSFYYFIAVFCFILAILALYDYWRFRQSGETDDMILQLPPFLKKRIHLIMGRELRDHRPRSVFSLAASAFVIGVLVSLLEAVCTGQVYVPTIVFILKNTQLKVKAATYLLLYNFMFVLPLIVVFLLSFFGFSSQRFNKELKKNLGRIKILMSILFLLLGVVILLIS